LIINIFYSIELSSADKISACCLQSIAIAILLEKVSFSIAL
jgi:hypothetical protein